MMAPLTPSSCFISRSLLTDILEAAGRGSRFARRSAARGRRPLRGSPPVTANQAQFLVRLLWLLQQGARSCGPHVPQGANPHRVCGPPKYGPDAADGATERDRRPGRRHNCALRRFADHPLAALLKVGRPPAEIEQAVSAACQRERERLHANVRWLNLITAVAPWREPSGA